MSKFPLYNNLLQEVKSKELTLTQKKDFMTKIETVDKDGHEFIYALIKTYQMENEDSDKCFTVPYNGIYIDKDLNFDLNKLPKKLKQILYRFINIHLEKMEEENNIKKQTPVKRM